MAEASRGIVDAWAQPALKAGLARLPEVVPLLDRSGSIDCLDRDVGPEEMLELMDAAGVEAVMLSAWHRPGGWVFSNDDVAAFVRRDPRRFLGVAAVDLEKPVARGSGTRTRGDRAGVQGPASRAVAVEPAPERPAVLPALRQMHRARHPVLHASRPYGPLDAVGAGAAHSLSRRGRAHVSGAADRRRAHRVSVDRRDARAGVEARERLHRHVRPSSALLPGATRPVHEDLRTEQGPLRHQFSTTPFQKCVEQAKALDLPDASARAFFTENARRVFNIG